MVVDIDQTAFFGKWHMGNTGDQPQPGFDHCESFQGQGSYYSFTLNVNGTQARLPESDYITDVLTDHTVD